MLALIDYISSSGLSAGLYAWTSMFDLCITQVPATYPYDGPFLKVSPLPDTNKVEFRYIDTRVKQQQCTELWRQRTRSRALSSSCNNCVGPRPRAQKRGQVSFIACSTCLKLT